VAIIVGQLEVDYGLMFFLWNGWELPQFLL